MTTQTCDVLVIGSGAAGLATAITAKKKGLDVIVLEKDYLIGGTTAFSGGVLWIPGNRHARARGIEDSREAALTYLQHESGERFDRAAAECYVDHAAEMVEFFERETEVRFVPTLYPDYHPTAPGGVDVGRSILAEPYDIRRLGADMARLRPPLETITFMGMMFNSSNADLKHFFNTTRSLESFLYVSKRLALHLKDLALYRRAVQVTSGNALAARLAKSALALGIPIRTAEAVQELLLEQGRVAGAVSASAGQSCRLLARRGVVLACGGFSHDRKRIANSYPHLRRGGEHLSPVPQANTGDGVALAERVGGGLDRPLAQPSAWMPVSRVPLGKGRQGVFPHLLDRYKPGVIGVLRNGRRFTNESQSYHDVGAALIQACEGEGETAMWLVCDQLALARYGLGYAKPAPMPVGPLVKKGYLFEGRTLAELAQKAGLDAAGLESTVREYNYSALSGEDPAFGRGGNSFNRYLADPANQPNPCVAPLARPPFYAVKVIMGDLGTFDGLRTGLAGEVLDVRNQPIPGLYAAGNDRVSMMGGNYPGAGITLGPAMTFGYLTGLHLAGADVTRTVASHREAV